MGRRRKKEEEKAGGLPLWMATFSDLVTLLLTFFVLLVSMANFEDVQKVDAVLSSIRKALGVNGMDHRVAQVFEEEAFTKETTQSDTIRPMVAKLREAFSEHVSDHFIEMTETQTEVRIRLDGRVFFRVGSAELHPAAYAVLADVGAAVVDEPVDIRIEGYADGVGSEEANWQLSTDRSVAVVMALREKGPVAGERLEAVGLGSWHPGSEIDRDADWDRRVEIVLRSNDLAGAAAASRASDRGSQ